MMDVVQTGPFAPVRLCDDTETLDLQQEPNCAATNAALFKYGKTKLGNRFLFHLH